MNKETISEMRGLFYLFLCVFLFCVSMWIINTLTEDNTPLRKIQLSLQRE